VKYLFLLLKDLAFYETKKESLKRKFQLKEKKKRSDEKFRGSFQTFIFLIRKLNFPFVQRSSKKLVNEMQGKSVWKYFLFTTLITRSDR
jgi:hypothetical protein